MRATQEDWDAWCLADCHIGDGDDLGVIARRLYDHLKAKYGVEGIWLMENFKDEEAADK